MTEKGAEGIPRRNVLRSTLATGLVLSVGATGVGADEREGETLEAGSEEATSQQVPDLVDAVTTAEFANAVVDWSFDGVADQAAVFDQELQGFPVPLEETDDPTTMADADTESTDGDTTDTTQVEDAFTLLSSGRAEEAPNHPEHFASTDVSGESIPNYSPDNYQANNIATLSFDFVVPEGSEGIAFDWKFGTDESPEFLGSQFQDFFEAVLITPDGSFQNIALLPDETPVTVDNADNFANTPGGTSQNPTEPLPEPPDIAYNAVTELQTAVADVSAYQGQTVRLRIRVADASDGVYDSAALLDNLRFLGDVDVETSVTPAIEAMDNYQAAVNDAIDTSLEAYAREEAILFREVGEPDEMIDYFGIKAGSLPQSAIDPDVFEAIDDSIDNLTTDRAQHLYTFLTDLYDDADPTDSVEQLTTQFATKYETEYAVGGQRIAEIRSEFNQSFEDLQADVIDDLQTDGYDSSDVDRVASYWNDRRLEIERRSQEYVSDSEDYVYTLLEDGDFTGHLISTERELESEVSANAIGATFLVGILLKKAAAGGVASKAVSGTGAAGTAISGKVVGLGSAAATAALSTAKAAKGVYAAHKHAIHIIGSVLKLVWEADHVGGPNVLPDEFDLPEDADEIIDHERRDVAVLTTAATDVDVLDTLFSGDGLDVGVETGTVAIQNTGLTSFTPDLDLAIRAKNLPPAGESATKSYPVQLTEPVPELAPGQQTTLEVEYTVPVGVYTSDYELVAEVPAQDAVGTASFESGVLQLPNITSQTLADDTISDGDTAEVTTPVDPDTENVTFDLTYSQLNCDLHVYDEGDIAAGAMPSEVNANHVGFNYAANEFESEIPGVTFSGRDEGVTGEEYISIQGVDTDAFTVQTVAPDLETVIQGDSAETIAAAETQSNIDGAGTITTDKLKTVHVTQDDPDITYLIEETAVSSAPPTLSVSTGLIDLEADRGDDDETTIAVSEAGGFEGLSNVSASTTEFTGEYTDHVIHTDAVSITDGIDVGPGGTEQLSITVAIPDDIEPDLYYGEIEISSNGESSGETIPVEINVEMHPSGVYEDLFEAVDADDTGDLTRDEVREMIQGYAQENTVDDVPITRDEVRRLIQWYSQS
ncbi:choice-of-anchor L domain-containing protein [Natrialbaceae archaeon A-arb3/5]